MCLRFVVEPVSEVAMILSNIAQKPTGEQPITGKLHSTSLPHGSPSEKGRFVQFGLL